MILPMEPLSNQTSYKIYEHHFILPDFVQILSLIYAKLNYIIFTKFFYKLKTYYQDIFHVKFHKTYSMM